MKKSSSLTPNRIIGELEQCKTQLRGFGVTRIGLFGSFLKRADTPESDLDFLVSFSKPTYDNYIELKFLLEKLFGRKADLVVESALKPALRYVKKEAIYAAL